MSYVGTVEKGVVVLPPEAKLADGTRVNVEPVLSVPQPRDGEPSIWDKLQSLAGKAKGLPTDLAENHDHYLHGAPKRRES